jgi:DNA-binding Lrp family transcriptional regulator
MKFKEADLKIISYAQHQANKPVKEIAKAIRLQEHSVRYALKNFTDKEIIKKRLFVNLHKIGLTRYGIFFNLAAHQKEIRQKIIKELSQTQGISWFCQLGGDFQFNLNICCKHVGEVAKFFDHFKEKYASFIMDKNLAARLELHYFGIKYLYNFKNIQGQIFQYKEDYAQEKIDDLDHQILSALDLFGVEERQKISKLLKIPLSTYDYRKEKLQSRGIIENEYYDINPNLMGYQSFLFIIATRSFTAKKEAEFLNFCQKHSAIVLLIKALGGWDFELRVDVLDSAAAASVQEEIYDSFGSDLQWIKILPTLRVLRISEFPFHKA